MIKKILFCAAALLCLLRPAASAQLSNPDTLGAHCGITPSYIESMGMSMEVSNIPAGFPGAAIKDCGKFRIYYYDLAYRPGQGFGDPLVGITRQNTLCSVLTYVQSVFDFSNIPPGQFIRLKVDTSFTLAYPPATPASEMFWGAPFYAPALSGSVVNGFAHDYIKSSTGTDPKPGSFHGSIRMNFGQTSTYNHYSSTGHFNGILEDADFQNGLSAVNNCQFDLYSCLLHSVGHVLGFLSLRDISHGGVYTTTNYTSMDTAVRTGPSPAISALAYTTPLVKFYPTAVSLGATWRNNNPAPYRINGGPELHMLTPYSNTRVGQGDSYDPVMTRFLPQGKSMRTFSKEELQLFKNSVGLNFHPAFAGSSSSAFYYSNRRPYCSKNFSYRYNRGFISEFNYFDTVKADFTMVNNVSSSLVYHLAADTSLHDDDGDSLRIFPGSLVNYRGCGQGGNNHKLLTVSNGGKTITYTPRPNFYGRAQFAYNLFDGKEKGAYIIITIDVAKGSNVNVAYGENLVLNGDFEEGTEVQLLDTAELVDNTSIGGSFDDLARIRQGFNFSDCHPYSNGVAIKGSYAECAETSVVPYPFGRNATSFPWITNAGVPGQRQFPDAYLGQGNRYQNTQQAGLYNLGDTMKKCRTYLLEFDAIRTENAALYRFINDTITIGFTNNTHKPTWDIVSPPNVHKIQSYPKMVIKAIDHVNWQHFSIPLTYCNDSTANVLFLEYGSIDGTYLPSIGKLPDFLLDNVSLKETAFTATVTDSLVSPCVHRLTARPSSINACSTYFSYTWKTLAGKVLATTSQIIEVSPRLTTTYILTVSNGCATASDTITVAGSNCPCTVASILGDTLAFYTLSGTTATVPALEAYYVAGDVRFTADVTIKNANVLIARGARISVAPGVKLTLDSAHLFTCPDSSTAMWEGITLESNPSVSAKIDIRNNSMIEDAYLAVDAQNVRNPGSGNVISINRSVFNRNFRDVKINGIYISGPAAIYPVSIYDNVFTARTFKLYFPEYPKKWPTVALLKRAPGLVDTKAPYVVSQNYLKASCKDGQFSRSAIELYDIGSVYGGAAPPYTYSEIYIGGGLVDSQANVFDNKRYGVISQNSNLSLVNNRFINIGKRMNPDGSFLRSEGGMGVAAICDTFNKFKRLQLIPSGHNCYNGFHDCFIGIYTDGIADLSMRYVTMSGSHTMGTTTPGADRAMDTDDGFGILTNSNKFLYNYYITSAKISNMVNGIVADFANPKAGTAISISENNLYAANPELSAGITGKQYMKNAMLLSTATSGTSNTLAVNGNFITNAFNGIQALNFKTTKVTLDSNVIVLKDTITSITGFQYGIYMENTMNALLKKNYISTAALGPITSDRMRGVFAAFNSNLSVCSNTTTNVGRGFEFAQKTPQIGTRWIENTMNNGWKGFVLGSDIGDQGFMENHVTLSPKTFYGGIKNKWSISGAGKVQTFVNGTISASLSKLHVFNITTGLAEMPTTNSTIIPGYEYKYTGTTGSIRLPFNQYEANCEGAWYPRVSYPPMKPGFKLLGMLVASDSLGYDLNFRKNQWMAQMALYEMGVYNPDYRDSSTAFDSFMNAAANSRIGRLSAIEQAIASGNLSGAQSLLNSPMQAMGRVLHTPELIITDYTEANHVVDNYTRFYGLQLKYLSGTMNASDTAALDTLARKCPATDGAVVYNARALYRTLTQDIQSYNDDGCMNTGGITDRKTTEGMGYGNELQEYTLYPNPNEGRFSVRQLIPEDREVEVRLYNSIGLLISKEKLQFTNGVANFNTRNALPGLYLLCLADTPGKTSCLKFNIK